MSSISKKLTNIDGYIFETIYGPWDYESSVSIYDSSDLNTPIDESEYKLFPREGRVIFDTTQYGDLIIEIQDKDKVRVGIRISNDDNTNGVDIYGLGTMHSNISSIGNYLQNVPEVPTTETTIVCSASPWISCVQPSQSLVTVTINSVSGNECFDVAHGTYIYDSILNTVGFTGWWFSKTDRDVALIIIYCKETAKFYAEIYDRTGDIALFGATANEATCTTLDNDRFKDITASGTCCDQTTSLVVGTFTLDGVNNCPLFSATVQISKDTEDTTIIPGTAAVLSSTPVSDSTINLGSISSSVAWVHVGSNAGLWPWPFNTNYSTNRLQSIYLASEIGTGGTIRSLGLHILTAPTSDMMNFTIRLKHTALASYVVNSWEDTGWTTVYSYESSSDPMPTGWVTSIFQTPFIYNGTDNLMIDISFSGVTTGGTIGSVWYTSFASNRSIYLGNNSIVAGHYVEPIDWSGATPLGNLSNSVSDVTVGFVQSPSSTSTITFTNTGGTSIHISEPSFPMSNVQYFAFDSDFTTGAVDLVPGASVVYGVYFVGSDVIGTYTDVVVFDNDSPQGQVSYVLSITVT